MSEREQYAAAKKIYIGEQEVALYIHSRNTKQSSHVLFLQVRERLKVKTTKVDLDLSKAFALNQAAREDPESVRTRRQLHIMVLS